MPKLVTPIHIPRYVLFWAAVITTNLHRAVCTTTEILLSETKPVKYIQSPNFPGEYPNNLYKVWSINTEYPIGYVQLTVEHMDTEGCNYDVLIVSEPSVYGGTDYETTQTWCGSDNPGSYRLRVGHARLAFDTDSAVAESGFSIRAELVDATCNRIELTYGVPQNVILPIETRSCINVAIDRDTCQGDCGIRLEFEALEIKKSSYCQQNYLAILDEENDRTELVRFCGDGYSTGAYYTDSDDLTLALRSAYDGDDVHVGMTVTSVDALDIGQCVGRISIPMTGEFVAVVRTENYPDDYPKQSFCHDVELLAAGTGVDDSPICVQFDGLKLGHQDCLHISRGFSHASPSPLDSYCEADGISHAQCYNTTELGISFETYTFSRSWPGFRIRIATALYFPDDPLTAGEIAGIVIGVLLGIFLICALTVFLVKQKRAGRLPHCNCLDRFRSSSPSASRADRYAADNRGASVDLSVSTASRRVCQDDNLGGYNEKTDDPPPTYESVSSVRERGI